MSPLAAAITGLAVAPLFAVVGAASASRLRDWRYRRAKAAAAKAALPAFVGPLPAVVRTPSEKTIDEAAKSLFEAEHDASNQLQSRSVFHLFAATAALLAAFVTAAASVTVASAVEPMHVFSAALDVAALLIVGWAFMRSRTLRAQWLRQRARAEFFRQWRAVDLVVTPGRDAMTPRHDAFVESVDTRLALGNDLHLAVLAFGRDRVREIRAAVADNTQLSTSDLDAYFLSRPVGQVRWFTKASLQIATQQEVRARLMMILFLLGLAAAITKCASLLFLSGHEAHFVADIAMVTLLAAIGLSTASTSAYLGQNLRSVRHRYEAQLSEFEAWFETYRGTVFTPPHGNDDGLTLPNRAAAAAAIADFEQLMITELLDWLRISDNDVMELAPA